MAFLGGLFNTGSGSNWKAQGTNILQPSTVGQANTAYDQTQQGIQQQQAFLNALQGQNGIGNQSSVFNQLQGVANGQGPNPAQAMLNQSTGQNVANQASLMAGQRGSGANTGLIARQAANQGANTQQQAAGQAATMQANQSMGALNQLGGIAGQQVGQQANALTGLNQAAQGQQQNILGGIQGQNASNVAMQDSINKANGQIANTNAGAQNNLAGGFLSGIGSVAGSLIPGGGGGASAGGGLSSLAMFADGGQVENPGVLSNVAKSLKSKLTTAGAPAVNINGAPLSDAQQMTNTGKTLSTTAGNAIGALGNAAVSGISSLFAPTPFAAPGAMPGQAMPMAMNSGGNVPAMLSPGEKYLPPTEAKKVAKGEENINDAGRTVKGTAKVQGDSLKNDTVPATLQEGGFVIPRSIMQSEDPERNAAAFIRAHMSRSQQMGKK